jgi:hypothetical protein
VILISALLYLQQRDLRRQHHHHVSHVWGVRTLDTQRQLCVRKGQCCCDTRPQPHQSQFNHSALSQCPPLIHASNPKSLVKAAQTNYPRVHVSGCFHGETAPCDMVLRALCLVCCFRGDLPEILKHQSMTNQIKRTSHLKKSIRAICGFLQLGAMTFGGTNVFNLERPK